MSRINTNVQSLVAQHVLGRQNKSLSTSLERLSTGTKINAGKDNPAGLIASENLRGQKAGIAQAITNAERANSIIGTAEGALNEVSSLLVDLQTLVTETFSKGGLTTEEITANQSQVDAIIASIDRIATSTQFGGKALLDGTLAADFVISPQADSATVVNVTIASVASDALGKTEVVPATDPITYWYLDDLDGTAGALKLTDAATKAEDVQAVVSAAAKEIADLRGTLGSFQKYTLAPTINSLEVALENVSSAESAVRDTDFAAETSSLTRSQILSSAATNVLAMANSMPQSVLQLLRG